MLPGYPGLKTFFEDHNNIKDNPFLMPSKGPATPMGCMISEEDRGFANDLKGKLSGKYRSFLFSISNFNYP